MAGLRVGIRRCKGEDGRMRWCQNDDGRMRG